jgi:hypothetical protein
MNPKSSSQNTPKRVKSLERNRVTSENMIIPDRNTLMIAEILKKIVSNLVCHIHAKNIIKKVLPA